jgi:hypothetical protein
MRCRSLFIVVISSVFPICFVVAQGDASKSSSAQNAAKVDLTSVVRVLLAKDTPGFSIAYDYEFPQRSSVYLKGLGMVPGTGSFRYLTTDTNVEFRDAPGGAILASVPLQETVVVAAKPPLLLTPQNGEFPDSAQTFMWDSSNPLQERAEAVLNKYFHYAPSTDCREMAYLRTTFTPLELKNVGPGVRAQLALLISYPCTPSSGKFPFQIKSLVMEGRSHSDDFRITSDPAIVRSADGFVESLIAEMKAGESGKP